MSGRIRRKLYEEENGDTVHVLDAGGCSGMWKKRERTGCICKDKPVRWERAEGQGRITVVPGCGKSGKEQDASVKTSQSDGKEQKDKAGSEESATSEEIPANQNLLTGVLDLTEGAIGKRPVAVMVNNVDPAMPQYGVGKADIIFEIPVEGDATRFMALYGDYTAVPKICAIRSCRAYFPALSEGFDAFYVNWGSDDTIGEYIDALNLDQIDGISDGSGLFGRDQARLSAGYDLEHTGYFDGTQFASVVQSRGLRTDIEEDKKDAAFQFYGLDEQVKPDGEDCRKVDINFGAARATLTYDEAKKVYVKDLNGNPQIDGNTGEQLAFTNVFVLETSITVRDEIGHKEVDWDGASDSVGYYISNGGVQKIHWSKEEKNEQSRLKFYDQDGKEIKINRGKSYIAVNYADQATFQ